MTKDSTSVNTGGGSVNMTSSAIGKGNVIRGNQSAVESSRNSDEILNYQDFIVALHYLRDEIDKSTDLPADESKDLRYNLDEAIEATEKDVPKKERVLEKLTVVQGIIDTLKNSVASTVALGGLVSKALVAAGTLL